MLDIDSAFLNGEAPPNTYVLPQPGYERKGFLWKLNKSLYIMATSPKTWLDHFTKTLLEFGLEQLRIEPCLFTLKGILSVIIYVDGVRFAGTQQEMEIFKLYLKQGNTV